MSQRYKFFSHKDCEFFPCHPGADRENFNCLFCFCPLYALGENCGGSYSLLPNGVKDCSRCLYPHEKEHYDAIMAKLKK
ncbi:cysteine-rich small domain-containing protein [Acidaminococcus sp. NSJ-142]|jgi:Zn-finger protein|uniref:cysteine-rich small domain-containing protein n=1 Tax=Acidaminococcus TaxID=904 RepID=UPI000CF947FE|nr:MULTISPECIES: cysteine-rich small domain-containing protein [Acidaminococcus]MCD2434898.1 cysteine-rich small domain-containing protein [Acidaminococcus hominis]MCH4096033.1 cysteine-rich small domain-containing protein [Acidaminococcus provencensis]RHK02315.1 metal-binding protein [Acidaminococcus sp. AM05-11]